MEKYQVKDHADSLLPEGKCWKLIFSDEFDGDTLDTTKWAVRTHMMGKRAKHFVNDAYAIKDSNIHFRLELRNGIYCTTQLQTGYNFMDGEGEAYDATASEGRKIEGVCDKNYFTWPIGEIKEPKFIHRYGYYECRCKMQQKPGWWSAFWLQSPTIGATLDPVTAGVEVDIMEQFERNEVVQCNNHWNGYGSQHRSTGAVESRLTRTVDGYHYFGLYWNEERYDYYVDGMLVNSFMDPVSHIPQFILLSTEAVGYRCADWNRWDDLRGSEGDIWSVDHVRVFDEVG